MIIEDIQKLYKQPWRFHHTLKHVEYIQSEMEKWLNEHDMNYGQNKDIIFYAALFHDAIYNPKGNDNEEKSAQLWKDFANEHKFNIELIDIVTKIILSTKHPESLDNEWELVKQFNIVDWMYMGETSIILPNYAEQLVEYEHNIFKEYQFVSVDQYVKGRAGFLFNAMNSYLITHEVYNYLITLLNRKYTIGYYVGSFNPFHIGHLNVLNKAEKIFDKVIIAQGLNPEKSAPENNLSDDLPYHKTETYSNQLVDFINSKRTKYCNPVLVRGLRNGFDLSQESNLISFVNEQADARGIERIPVVYISCDKEFEHVSSSAIKMLPEKDKERYIPKC